MFMAPLFVILFLAQDSLVKMVAIVVFTLAAITDYVDGWWARRNKLVTPLGVFLDPLADKVLVLAAMFAFSLEELIPLWMVLIVVARDVLVTGLRMYAESRSHSIVTSRSAKIKTFLQMTFIIYVLTLNAWETLAPEVSPAARLAAGDPDVLFYGMGTVCLVTIWTGAQYLVDNRTIFGQLPRAGV